MRQIFVEHITDISETYGTHTHTHTHTHIHYIYMRQIFVEYVTLVEYATDICGTYYRH